MGDTLYNMLRLEETEIGPDERPVHPHKITRAEVIKEVFVIEMKY